jgi:CMP/dCMP kinase
VRVAIAGLPGSGKTTAAKRVAQDLGVPLVSAGGIFRALAEEQQMTLAQFSALAERDPAIDRQLDQRMAQEARKGPLVMEGRLTAWVCREFKVPAFKVRLDASEGVRAERIARRESIPPEQALLDNRRREQSERTRYLRYYGADMGDDALYDLVLDTDRIGPDDVARRITDGASAHGQG